MRSTNAELDAHAAHAARRLCFAAWARAHPVRAFAERVLDRALTARGLRIPLSEASRAGHTIRSDAGDPYLTRHYLWRRWRRVLPGVFLHYFHRSDSDRELHNHPWKWAYAFVLTSGYEEERRVNHRTGRVRRRYIAPFTVNRIGHDTFHRVKLALPEEGAFTLFIAGPRATEERPGELDGWGFCRWLKHERRGWWDYEDNRQRELRKGRS